MKKLFVSILLVVLVLGFSTLSLADSTTILPGKTKFKTYSISASPSYTVSFASNVSTGMRCNVVLSLNDLQIGEFTWKRTSSATLVKDSFNSTKTLRPESFKFVSGRSNKARLSFIAPQTNSSAIIIIYPGN